MTDAGAKALKALELYDLYETVRTDRGGKTGPKGRAWQAFLDAKAEATEMAAAPGDYTDTQILADTVPADLLEAETQRLNGAPLEPGEVTDAMIEAGLEALNENVTCYLGGDITIDDENALLQAIYQAMDAVRPRPVAHVTQGGELTTLGACPPGLFLLGSTVGFKTEYRGMVPVGPTNVSGDLMRWTIGQHSEVYVVASGEAFWGGETSIEARENLLVTPIDIEKVTPVDEDEEHPWRTQAEWSALLRLRDDFIVERGLWLAFTDQLEKLEQAGIRSDAEGLDQGAVIWALQAAYDLPRGERWLPELVEDRKAIRRVQNSKFILGALVAALHNAKTRRTT